MIAGGVRKIIFFCTIHHHDKMELIVSRDLDGMNNKKLIGRLFFQENF